MSEARVMDSDSGNQENSQESLLTIQDLKKYYPVKRNLVSTRRDKIQNFGKSTEPTPISESNNVTANTTKNAFVKAVDSVSFSIDKSEIFALVGESGCGKTTIARMIVGLLRPTSGKIFFLGEEIDPRNRRLLKRMRRNVQIIFQDPYSSLDPTMKIGRSIAEPLVSYGYPRARRKERVPELLIEVGLRAEDAEKLPREFSGGQRQRIAIARALAVDPQLIIADEPVSALDISVRAQILNLLLDLRDRKHISFLIIAHDLSMVRHVADRVAVMHLGRIVELSSNSGFFENTLHPYSNALLSAVPIPDPSKKGERLVLKGELPSPINPPSGCRFHTRCVKRFEPCDKIDPQLSEFVHGHEVACHLYVQHK
jgi:oligopeptide/dipeptide ABC transporter ATP-binding protein